MGCSPSNKTTTKSTNNQDYPILDYKIVDTSISWIDVFEQEEERYLVYFYSEYCGYCKSVKEEFISYYLLNKEKIYFLDAFKEKAIYKNDPSKLIGGDNIEDFYIPGTPFLVELINWSITNYYFGAESIKMYVKSNQ